MQQAILLDLLRPLLMQEIHKVLFFIGFMQDVLQPGGGSQALLMQGPIALHSGGGVARSHAR